MKICDWCEGKDGVGHAGVVYFPNGIGDRVDHKSDEMLFENPCYRELCQHCREILKQEFKAVEKRAEERARRRK